MHKKAIQAAGLPPASCPFGAARTARAFSYMGLPCPESGHRRLQLPRPLRVYHSRKDGPERGNRAEHFEHLRGITGVLRLYGENSGRRTPERFAARCFCQERPVAELRSPSGRPFFVGTVGLPGEGEGVRLGGPQAVEAMCSGPCRRRPSLWDPPAGRAGCARRTSGCRARWSRVSTSSTPCGFLLQQQRLAHLAHGVKAADVVGCLYQVDPRHHEYGRRKTGKAPAQAGQGGVVRRRPRRPGSKKVNTPWVERS